LKKSTSNNQTKGPKKWLKKLGWAGFLFFLLKGIVWIFILYGVSEMTQC